MRFFYFAEVSIEEIGLGVRAVDGGVAAGRPAGAVAKKTGVIDIAKIDRAATGARLRGLRVAAHAKI